MDSILLYSSQKGKVSFQRKYSINEETRKKFTMNQEQNDSTHIHEDKSQCTVSENSFHNKGITNSSLSSATPKKNLFQISYNPFEVKPESLQLHSCSPSVFASLKTKKQRKTFRWSIEQLATLHPVDIDETSQQESGDLYLDSEMEEKAQKAIETFFSQNNIVPSPWGALAKHVTFSPNLASTAYYTRFEKSLNDSQGYDSNYKKDVWTQTMLTLPPNFNLMELLAPYFTFEDVPDNNNCNEIEDELYNEADSLSNSSFRRKLFSRGADRILAHSLHSTKLQSPPLTPKSHGDHDSYVCTPTSSQSSSSPLTPRHCPRHCSLIVGTYCTPPEISPIGKSIFQTPSTSSRSEGIDVLPSSSSTEHVKSQELSLRSSYLLSCNKMNENDSESEMLPIIKEIPKLNVDVLDTSVADMSCESETNNVCFESSIIDNQANETKLSDKEMNLSYQDTALQGKHKQLDLQHNSVTQDTGYQTGSSEYVQLNIQSGLHHRLCNAVQALDSSNISTSNFLQDDSSGNTKKQITLPNIHKKLNENRSSNASSNFSVTAFQEQCPSEGFNPLSWKPYQCSTPSKKNYNRQIL
ncbi:protein aurora borealis [Centruroides vittatus]|uniref:protein aurora borealis n=1 Tax=Centruroides vittatus TaxID=120091 RepID=UPI003510483A